jgi:hypothetical protein
MQGRGGALHLSKVVGFAQSMVQFDGKCASCGVSRQHKNFAGRRDGRPIPDPCHVALQPGRSPKDDRLCTVCYNIHLAEAKTAAPPAATPPSTRRRSSTSSLDGVQWSETASDRVAKVVRRDSSGEPVIPLALHEQKMGEQAKALGHESLNMWEARTRPSEVLQEQFVVEGVF